MKFIRKIFVKYFGIISGDKAVYSLEQRLFHFVVAGGIVFIILSDIDNLLLKNHIMTIVFPSIFLIASLLIYYISRFKNKYSLSVWIFLIMLLFVITPVVWFFNGGSAGGFHYFVMLFCLVLSSLLRGKARIITLIIYLAAYIIIIIAEYYRPGLIVGYQTRLDRYFDVSSSMIMTIIMSVILFIVYINAYDQEKITADNYSAELENERNIIGDKFDEMNQELDMARAIQRQFIVNKNNPPFIDFIYHPMAKLGGDFLHLFPFRYTDEIGIFISDVSGHGVPGALITGMIYSHLLEIVPRNNNPAGVLESLNKVLFGNTGSNFIKAIYGIYYPASGEFNYSNAGGNSPYIIENGISSLLDDTERSLPLAVLSNPELAAMGKPYSASRVSLKKGSKLFLYTNGIMDAVDINIKEKSGNASDFEHARFPGSVKELFSLPAKEFSLEMMAKLEQFRGRDEFEDDICFACLDII